MKEPLVTIQDQQEAYCEYLQKRTLIGTIYHQRFLFPRICSFLHGNILDFGCGIGEFLKFRSDAVGVDINEYNVDFCKSMGLNAFVLKDDGKTPFESSSFTGVVMDNVIEHISLDKVDSCVAEVKRLLIPGGILVIGIPGMKGYAMDDDHQVFYTETSLNVLLQRHGFRRKSSFYMPLPWTFLSQYLSQYCIYVVFQVGTQVDIHHA